MNFGLSAKYSWIDFETVKPADLRVIGGGCGGGGGSTTVQAVRLAAQSAASAAGANNVGSYSIGDPSPSADLKVTWTTTLPGGASQVGTAYINSATGQVVSSIVATSGTTSASSGGGFWSSVSSFFGWLFGSH